jgi:DNA-binding NarL/FixJ family response regulator
MIGRGLTVSDIAGELNLSVKTVSTHRSHILKKMNMDSNAQMMRYTLERHLTD